MIIISELSGKLCERHGNFVIINCYFRIQTVEECSILSWTWLDAMNSLVLAENNYTKQEQSIAMKAYVYAYKVWIVSPYI